MIYLTYYKLILLVNIAPRDILLLGYFFFLNLAKALGEITLDGLIIYNYSLLLRSMRVFMDLNIDIHRSL
jgi:hypothetical protein